MICYVEASMKPKIEQVTEIIMKMATNGEINDTNRSESPEGIQFVPPVNILNKDLLERPTTCVNFKELVLSVLKHQGWTINDVKFSDKGNLESINIKFSNEFSLGNSPWDPRLVGQDFNKALGARIDACIR